MNNTPSEAHQDIAVGYFFCCLDQSQVPFFIRATPMMLPTHTDQIHIGYFILHNFPNLNLILAPFIVSQDPFQIHL